MVDRDHIDFWGVNMRLQPLQAIVASHGLDRLEKTITGSTKMALLMLQKLFRRRLQLILEILEVL